MTQKTQMNDMSFPPPRVRSEVKGWGPRKQGFGVRVLGLPSLPGQVASPLRPRILFLKMAIVRSTFLV